MEDEDIEQSVCVDCGANVFVDDDRCYRISDDDTLCFECAIRRKGQYDGIKGEWVVPPDLSGLPNEQRPHP